METKPNLAECQIQDIPDRMYYVANFITVEEEAKILESMPTSKWIQLQHRRLQTWPSVLTKNNVLLDAPLPTWLEDPVITKFKELGLFEDSPHGQPNHVLINEYNAGEGIMPHEDGAAYFPIVATVSLSSTLCLDIYEKKTDEVQASDQGGARTLPRWRVLQEPRSLLITCGSAYTETLHGISEVVTDENLNPDTVANWNLLGNKDTFLQQDGKNIRETRISLTYRDVLKVSKLGTRILGRARG